MKFEDNYDLFKENQTMSVTEISPVFSELPTSLPDHTQLPESDGSFVKNFQEHPQSLLLTDSLWPVLEQLHPNAVLSIGVELF